MNASAFLISALSAAAIRFVLGLDTGLDYDTTAMSSYAFDPTTQEPLARTPWALRLRPDILLSWFDTRNYIYFTGNGAFVQPFSFQGAEYGDNPEGSGEVDLGARLQLGRRLSFHPGGYVRLMSSNAFGSSQDEVMGSALASRRFTALSYGGFLEFEFPAGRRLRFFLRAEAESWYLEVCGTDEATGEVVGSFVCIPPEVVEVQPTLTISGVLSGLIAITRRDGLALEVQVNDGLFLEETHRDAVPQSYDRNDQLNILGRVIYRRFWLPYLMTDLAVGITAVRPRLEPEPEPGTWVMAGGWEMNLVGALSIVWFGRPRWLNMNLSYERSYQQLQFRNVGAVMDAISLLMAFGPFEGFGINATLMWSRFGYEVERRPNAVAPGCAANSLDTCDPTECDPATGDCSATCEYRATTMRTFNTIGLALDVHYYHEIDRVAFGPFLEGYAYVQVPENVEVGNPNDPSQVRPCVENQDCYLPSQFDTFEAIVLLGFRLQWGYGNARPRRGMAGSSNAAHGTRDERRLALLRMDRDEQRIPGYAYGARPMTATEADEEALFGDRDPLGRMYGGDRDAARWDDEDDEDAEEQDEGEEHDGIEGDEEEAEQWDWIGEDERPPPQEGQEGEGGQEEGGANEGGEDTEDQGPILFDEDE